MIRALLFILIMVGCLFLRQQSPSPGNRNGQHPALGMVKGVDCAQCHKTYPIGGTHDPHFVAFGHGKSSQIQGSSCLECHQQNQCDDCHRVKKPEFHDSKFCQPEKGGEALKVHHLEGGLRKGSCVTCHRQNFQSFCGKCHQEREIDTWSKK